MRTQDDPETYILLLLSDSNLPTGSFVASSGLESYMKHGLAEAAPSADSAIVDFVRDSLASYARSTLPFVSDAHRLVGDYISQRDEEEKVGGVEGRLDGILQTLAGLDELYQIMTLNHVARRASMSQGVALLTLYSRGFSKSPALSAFSGESYESRTHKVFEQFKLRVRRGEVFGHLPICWGALTAALGLTLERSQYLHLFLHARSLLSASVRLNNIGPYGAQQILLFAVRPLVAAEAARCRNLQTGLLDRSAEGFNDVTSGPANTWPLGEILASRHDLQHSRIFNS